MQAQKTSADLDFVESKIERVDTLEYREYDIYLEVAKESFEKSVNLLDKIAFFLNDYCSVRMPDHRVSFFGNDSIWNFKGKKKGKQEPMRAYMKRRKNFALYGLYDLYLDFAHRIEIGGKTNAPAFARLNLKNARRTAFSTRFRGEAKVSHLQIRKFRGSRRRSTLRDASRNSRW